MTNNEPSPRNIIEATPRTIAAILDRVEPGDTVLLRDGIYRGGLKLSRSGAEDAPIVLRAAGDCCVIDGGAEDCLAVEGASWVKIARIRFQHAGRAGLSIMAEASSPASHVTVRKCVFADNRVWGLVTSHTDHLLIEGNDAFASAVEHGIYVANSGDDPVIRDNLVHHNAGNGIHINGDPDCGGDGIISRALVEGNIIWENGRARGGSAMSVMHVQDSLFRNNLLYANQAAGFVLFWYTGDMAAQSSVRNKVVNNTVWFRPGEGRSCLLMRNGARENFVKNNIFVGGARGVVFVEPSCLEGLVMDNNVIANYPGARLFGDSDTAVEPAPGAEYVRPIEQWQAAGFDPVTSHGTEIPVEQWRARGFDVHSSIGAMPALVDPERNDFRLKPGSVGIGGGADLSGIVDTDITGAPRPQGKGYDCGCYERPD